MPTFEAMVGPSAPLLAAACVLAGMAVGLGVYAFARRVRERAVRATATLDHASPGRRPAGPRGAARRDGLLRWILPPFTMIARGLPMTAVRVTLAERYARAGWPGDLEDDELPGLALVVGLALAVLAALLILAVAPLAAPLGLVAVLAGPGLVGGWLTRRAEARDRDIARTMPFVLDLLVLTMRAGAPLNTAMERVVIDYAGHPIGREFSAVLADMDLGVTKHDALENLSKRNPIPAVRTFSDDLNQAEELGRPVADALERLSDRSRQRRVQEATEMAGKAKVMVLVPGMLVFVATLILLFAPFAVRYFYGGYTGL